MKLNESAYDKWYLEYRALPEETDAFAIAGMQRNWARTGLDARFAARVEAAQAVLDSANVRVAESAQEMAKYESIQASTEALEGARTSMRQARADATQAQTDLAAAKASR